MDRAHALRMMDCETVDAVAAAEALAAGRLVYAVELPGGSWGQVEAVEALRRGRAFAVTFASGKSRVFKRRGTFWVERVKKAWEA